MGALNSVILIFIAKQECNSASNKNVLKKRRIFNNWVQIYFYIKVIYKLLLDKRFYVISQYSDFLRGSTIHIYEKWLDCHIFSHLIMTPIPTFLFLILLCTDPLPDASHVLLGPKPYICIRRGEMFRSLCSIVCTKVSGIQSYFNQVSYKWISWSGSIPVILVSPQVV